MSIYRTISALLSYACESRTFTRIRPCELNCKNDYLTDFSIFCLDGVCQPLDKLGASRGGITLIRIPNTVDRILDENAPLCEVFCATAVRIVTFML